MKKQKNIKIKASNFHITAIAMLFIVAVMSPMFSDGIIAGDSSTGSFTPLSIRGYADYCSGGWAVNAEVDVVSSISTESTTVDSFGFWQVQVGDPGPNWGVGTSFTVYIDGVGAYTGWDAEASGVTTAPFTNMGTMTLDPPTLNSNANGPYTGLVGVSIQFTGSASGGATSYSWLWNFGDGDTSTEQNPTHTYTSSGVKTVTLTVTDQCSNQDVDSTTATINDMVEADANGPYSGYVNQPVQFTGSATGGVPPYSWLWNFGDGDTSTQQNPTHTYTSAGLKTVTLTVTDDLSYDDTDSTTADITLEPVVADANGPYSGTLCDPVQFYGSASGGVTPYSWEWDFGDGDTSTQQNPTHQYDDTGTHTVTLTVTDSAMQSDTDTTSASISYTDPTADAGGPYSGGINEAIHFSGSATGGCEPYSWSWNFGDGGTSTQQNPTHTYTTAGTFTVVLTVTDDVGGSDTDTTTAEIDDNPPLKAFTNGPYYGVPGEQIYFTGSATGGVEPYTVWYWEFGDGGTSPNKNTYHTYETAGEYTVELTVKDSEGTTAYDTTTAYITEDPIPNANGPYSGVVDQPLQFTGSVNGGTSPYSWLWNFGDGGTSTEQNPTHTYTTADTFTVTLTVTDDNGKTGTDETTATITFGNPDLTCAGSLSWSTKSQGTVTGSFTVSNIGIAGTNLDWEIDSFPSWGTWTFTPDQGDDLKPEDGSVSVQVTVVAPKGQAKSLIILSDDDSQFSGTVKVVNSDDSSDFCEIPVSLTVPKAYSPMLEFLQQLAQRIPILRLVLEIIQLI